MGEGRSVAARPDGERAAQRRPAQARIRRLGGPANAVRFSAVVARRVCARLEAGETLRAICRDAAMPNRSSVQAWARTLPAFAEAMGRARRAAGWHGEGGRKPRWCPHLAAEVCSRIADGQTMSAICADPDMPSLSLVHKWRSARPEFAADLELARQAQAERMCDLGWEIAQRITPKDAYATHVKLSQLRWTAAALAPARFGRVRPLEAEAAGAAGARGPTQVIFQMREFRRETQADGTTKVVAYLRNPATGELEREARD
ncbi:MAG: hypothetical protein GC203_20810 [Phenylobacterium sp.]|uniref:terminase small subunit-like protein n=1 Tax=Phenylobacterium sp. TaxID=1871053 RepID=UPI0025CE8CB3|nr:hypothetical protein [Phenylobacterium sp.]MBI1200308.1 hypothetical protein [Phenylobacterium sp.]